jgi:hypothetical protein
MRPQDVDLKFIITFNEMNEIQKHQWSQQISEHCWRDKIVLSDAILFCDKVHVHALILPYLDIKKGGLRATFKHPCEIL